LAWGNAQLQCQFLVGRFPGVAALEVHLRGVALFLKLTDRTGQGIELPEIIEHGAANPVLRQRFDLEAATAVESVNRLNQSNGAGGDEVFEGDRGRTPLVNPKGQ
jgi:hypothetical protein